MGRPKESDEPCRLAKALRLFAASKNLTDDDLAKAWELSRASTSRFMSGKATPDCRSMLRIVQWCLEREGIDV